MGKLAQSMMYGAKVFVIEGDLDETIRLFYEAIQKFGWFSLTIGNHFRFECDKTVAYEVCEQLDWKVPDRAVYPTGSGEFLSRNWKGFNEKTP